MSASERREVRPSCSCAVVWRGRKATSKHRHTIGKVVSDMQSRVSRQSMGPSRPHQSSAPGPRFCSRLLPHPQAHAAFMRDDLDVLVASVAYGGWGSGAGGGRWTDR